MTPEETALARQVVALPGFRWQTGMESCWSQLPEHGGNRTTFAAGHDRPHIDLWFQPERGRWTCDGPNLDHMGTAGVLLAMLHALPGMVWVRVVTKPYQPNTRVEWKFEGQEVSGAQADHPGVALAHALVAIGRCA